MEYEDYIKYINNFDVQSLDGETWTNLKIIDPSLDNYEISNYLRIKSLQKIIVDSWGRKYKKEARILKHVPHGTGYNVVGLNNKTWRVHKIVALVFVKNDDPEHKIVINHKNQNKTDNRPENLEWCTIQYNDTYGDKIERMKNTRKTSQKWKEGVVKTHEKRSLKIVQTDLNGNILKIWNSIAEANRNGYGYGGTGGCCKHRYNQYKGYKWFYLDSCKMSEEDIKKYIEAETPKPFENNYLKRIPVIQLSLNDEYIKTWDSIHSVEQGGYSSTCVGYCCRGKIKTHKGFKWMYLSEYEKLNK